MSVADQRLPENAPPRRSGRFPFEPLAGPDRETRLAPNATTVEPRRSLVRQRRPLRNEHGVRNFPSFLSRLPVMTLVETGGIVLLILCLAAQS